MPVHADEIEGLDDAIKAYLEQCVLNLDIEHSLFYSGNTLELTVQVVAPTDSPTLSWRGEVLMEGSVTFEVGEENEKD
jgi:hypothetical protein